MKSLIAIAVGSVLLLPIPAAAATQAEAVAESLVIAKGVWIHYRPCPGAVEVVSSRRSRRGLLASAVLPCQVIFNSRYQLSRATYCTVLVHEFGHLSNWRPATGEAYVSSAGQVDDIHSRNPRSVMFPRFNGSIQRACRRAFGDHASVGLRGEEGFDTGQKRLRVRL